MRSMPMRISFVCLTAVLGGCAQETVTQPARPVRAIKVEDISAIEGRKFPGRAKATQEINLSFRVGGELVSLPIDVGDVVTKGDVLSTLDPRDFQAALDSDEAARQQAVAELEAMRIARPEEIRRQDAAVREAKAVLELAEADYQRGLATQKANPGAIAQAAIDRQKAARDRSAALLDQNKESLTIAKEGARKEDITAKEAEIKSLEAAVAMAQNNLEYTRLTAPFDGTIVAKYVENYQTVLPRQAICRLLDTSRIEFVIDVPESMISLVPYVTDIVCVFDAFPDKEIPAKIKEIGTEASTTTRTYPVNLIMDQPAGTTILSGMAGTANGRVKRGGDAEKKGVVVPAGAVFTPATEKQSYVWIVEEPAQTVTRTPVTVGAPTAVGILVKEGLSAGQWIVTAGVQSLNEGQQVRRLTEGEE
jgi:multidrug efflux pump subunit AcrA (membrane-fusion protein)